VRSFYPPYQPIFYEYIHFGRLYVIPRPTSNSQVPTGFRSTHRQIDKHKHTQLCARTNRAAAAPSPPPPPTSTHTCARTRTVQHLGVRRVKAGGTQSLSALVQRRPVCQLPSAFTKSTLTGGKSRQISLHCSCPHERRTTAKLCMFTQQYFAESKPTGLGSG
jgi:hypothetical protein